MYSILIVLFLMNNSSLYGYTLEVHTRITNPPDWLIKSPQKLRPKIALVLSGGGSRGLSQIGVLKVLEQNKIPIDYIVGTSIGAIVGGLYATGYSADTLEHIVKNTAWDEMFSLLKDQDRNDMFLDQKIDNDRMLITLRFNDFSFVVPEAISNGNNFQYFLQKLLWNAPYYSSNSFDSLKIPFRAITTDLTHGKEYIIKEGNLIRAIRASATIPLRYTPIIIDSSLLVDGGIKNNIPVEAAQSEFSPDIIIAVNTVSPLLVNQDLNTPWSIADQVVGILLRDNEQKSLSLADITISPDLGYTKNTDFSDIHSLLNKGENAAQLQIESIKQLIILKQDSIFNQQLTKPLENIDSIKFNQQIVSGNTHVLRTQFSNILKAYFQNQSLCNDIECINIKEGMLNAEPLYPSIITASTVQIQDSLHILSENVKQTIQDSVSGLTHTQFNLDTIIKTKEKILHVLRNNHYSFIDVDYIYDNQGDRKLTWIITIPKVQNIIIRTNSKTVSDILKREIETIPSLLHSKLVNDSWEKISGSNAYQDIDFKTKIINDTFLLDIAVKQYPNQSIKLGARVDNERFGQLSLEAKQMELFGKDIEAYINIAGGQRNYKIEGTLKFPSILGSLWNWNLTAYSLSKGIYTYSDIFSSDFNSYTKRKGNELTEEHYGIKSVFSRYLGRSGLLLFDIRYDKQRFFDKTEKPDFMYSKICTAKLTGKYDTRDNADLPSKGTFLEFSLESSIFSFENNPSFSKAQFALKKSFTFENHTFTPSVIFGFSDNTLPIAEYFSLGRDDMFYGKREDDKRGLQLALASLEYRIKSSIKLFFPTYLSIRYDMGSTWSSFETIKIAELQHGLGIGIIADTPIGNARITAGKSFYFVNNPDGIVQGPLLFSFAIGTNF